MQRLDAAVIALDDSWPARRQRTDELITRYPHAVDMLRLYRALLDPQADAYHAALSLPSPLAGNQIPSPLAGEGKGGGFADIASFAVDRVLPGIIDVTIETGPPVLRDGVITLFATGDPKALMSRWLTGDTLAPVETYLARATCGPILEALAQTPSVSTPSPIAGEGVGGGSPRRCPTCGGLPQLSYFAHSGEALVSGHRYLLCSRCSGNWVFSRMTCAACGESRGPRLPIYHEQERFPHARVDGCRSCGHYLLTFDLRRDSRTVPVVDELACLPLDLYAIDQGLTKITPNLMGG